MNYYEKELNIIKKSNRLRKRKLFDENLIDLASNDYLGLSSDKTLLKKAYKRLIKEKYFSPKASMLVNGYSKIHQKFEKKLCKLNKFEDAVVVGSGFLANISLIESMIRKNDILFIDEQYHASGMLATKLVQGTVVIFKHNDLKDLELKIKDIRQNNKIERIVIAIEGVYSMQGDIAPKGMHNIATKNDAILIVDEAHSSGVIGDNLLGWFDFHNIKPQANHIKMGTLGKAYGSYGAYILASKHMISFLENRAKPIVYSTAPSLFDISLALTNLKYLQKNKSIIKKRIEENQKIVKKYLNVDSQSLIIPIEIGNNKKVIEMQNELIKKGYLLGAIRQPTVSKAIIRMIIKLDIKKKDLIEVVRYLKN